MNRRDTVLALLALGAAPLAARAQAAARLARIGLLLPNTQDVASANPRIAAFRQGMRDLGWIEGKNLAIEWRFADGQLKRLSELAADLARIGVDVMVTAAAPSAVAAKAASRSIPIVMLDPGDPVGLGLIESLARPGGNVTGVSSIAPQLAAKRLALLKEAVPSAVRVAVLFNSAIPPAEIAMREVQAAAASLGLQVQSVPVNGREGLAESFAAIARQRADAVIVFPDPLTFSNQSGIVGFAAANRVPVMYGAREFTEAGGLMSYGPDYAAMFRRGAYFVDRILKGARPSDLPVEQPATFDLVINLKSAKALALAIPQSVLLRADRVIE